MPIAQSVKMGEGVRVFYPDLVNMYNCSLGAQTTVGPFVEVQGGVEIGARCKISSHTFICEGVIIEDEVFIGSDTQLVAPVRVGKGATLGAGTTLTKDAPPGKLTISRAKQTTIDGWQRPVKQKKA